MEQKNVINIPDLPDLRIFCLRDSESFKEPFSSGEHTFYTNGYIIVRVPRIEQITKKPPLDIDIDELPWPDCQVSWVTPKKIIVNRERCGVCGGTGKVTKCEECEGDGFVSWNSGFHDYEADCETCFGDGFSAGGKETCDCCNGKGTVPERPGVAFEVSGVCLSTHVAEKIQQLPNMKISKTPINEGMLYFIFDGGDGIAMAWD